MKNIQWLHQGEDYTKYSYEDELGNKYEVEITGIAQQIINTLLRALFKKIPKGTR